MWGLTMIGGIGGSSGRSVWWGVLILPYLIGWSMGIWGPGSPRWMLWLGIVVGLLYQAILVKVVMGLARHHGTMPLAPSIIISTLGVLTIVGCLIRLTKRVPEGQ
jgi:hypothetical protein